MSRAPKEAPAEPEGTIAARRLVIGEATDWLVAAARLKAAGYQDGVIARAETEAAQRGEHLAEARRIAAARVGA